MTGIESAPIQEEEQWVTVDEAAEALGMARVKVMRLAREGHLRIRIMRGDRRKRFINLVALRAFMNSTTEEEL